MIKILRATYAGDYRITVQFSDGSEGDYDLAPLIERDTVLTRPLASPDYFRRFFIELGALCWPNGLELSPASIHKEMEQSGALKRRLVA